MLPPRFARWESLGLHKYLRNGSMNLNNVLLPSMQKRFSEDQAFQDRARAEVVKLQAHDPDVIQAWQLICDVSRRGEL